MFESGAINTREAGAGAGRVTPGQVRLVNVMYCGSWPHIQQMLLSINQTRSAYVIRRYCEYLGGLKSTLLEKFFFE